MLSLKDFRKRFEKKVAKYKLNWEVLGFLTPNGRIYQFGTDTKVISSVFEALVAPLVQEIADEKGYSVESSEQTIYPDFTLTPLTGKTPRIAIDVKTTYRRIGLAGNVQPFR